MYWDRAYFHCRANWLAETSFLFSLDVSGLHFWASQTRLMKNAHTPFTTFRHFCQLDAQELGAWGSHLPRWWQWWSLGSSKRLPPISPYRNFLWARNWLLLCVTTDVLGFNSVTTTAPYPEDAVVEELFSSQCYMVMKKTWKLSRILNEKTTPLLFTEWRAGEFLTISSGGVGMESLNYRAFA